MLQTKRFIGNDLARLYRRVRTELGEDALIFSTRTLHREGGAPLIEIQASPPADDDALPFELQQAMLSTVLSRVAPGMKVPDLEDLVLRGVLGPSAVADVTAATVPGDGIEDAADVYAPPAHPAEVPGQRMDERTTANDFMEAGISAAAAGAIEATYPGLAAEPALVAYLKRLPVTYPDEYETALVSIDGPAGGGRSTALLRMALDCSEAGRAAVLVATNAYRREEVDRLAAYAEVLGLDFVVAADDRGVEKAVRKVAHLAGGRKMNVAVIEIYRRTIERAFLKCLVPLFECRDLVDKFRKHGGVFILSAVCCVNWHRPPAGTMPCL